MKPRLALVAVLVGSFSAARAPAGDFNGDGRDDLVIGSHYNGGAPVLVGGLQVLYSNAGGPWNFNTTTLTDGVEPGGDDLPSIEFGTAFASGDFNGDGFDDLAVGAPDAPKGLILNAGAVFIYPGGPDGLVIASKTTLDQDVTGVRDVCESDDRFGRALAAADFDGDGRDDLAVSVSETVSGMVRAGAVQVFFGSATGLSTGHDQVWHQNRKGVLDKAEADDEFGAKLAAGDIDGDGRADLVIAIPGEVRTHDGEDYVGAFAVLFGKRTGFTAKADLRFDLSAMIGTQALQPGLIDGVQLAIGDFDDDGDGDLAIGLPQLLIEDQQDGGVIVVRWTGDTFDFFNRRGFVFGTARRLGESLAAGDYSGDGVTDLAAGAPGSNGAAGSLFVFRGFAGSGVWGVINTQIWTRDTTGVLGDALAGAEFGETLGSGDFNGDGSTDLAIGAPHEDLSAAVDTGDVSVLFGTLNAGLLSATNDQLWNMNSFGEPKSFQLMGWRLGS